MPRDETGDPRCRLVACPPECTGWPDWRRGSRRSRRAMTPRAATTRCAAGGRPAPEASPPSRRPRPWASAGPASIAGPSASSHARAGRTGSASRPSPPRPCARPSSGCAWTIRCGGASSGRCCVRGRLRQPRHRALRPAAPTTIPASPGDPDVSDVLSPDNIGIRRCHWLRSPVAKRRMSAGAQESGKPMQRRTALSLLAGAGTLAAGRRRPARAERSRSAIS